MSYSNPLTALDAPRVALNMIVRNEAAIIERALNSVLGHVQACIVCDTGSTDDTVMRIESFCQKNGMPFEVHHFEFVDFSQARNRALVCARASTLAFEYILLMDADMQLQVDEPDALRDLKAPAAMLRQNSGIIFYQNVRLLNRFAQADYIGFTHEVLRIEGEVAMIDGWHFLDHADGGNRPEKLERDERLLRLYLQQWPGDPRSLFYLAQTLKDKGENAAAIEAYQNRMNAGGWDEEIWYSAYQLAVCFQRMGKYSDMASACLNAYNLRSWRAEPIVLLARQYAQLEQHDSALLLLEQAQQIELPLSDRLFVEHQAYGDAIQELIGISGFYSNRHSRRERGQQSCENLAIKSDTNHDRRALARRNLFFYAKSWFVGSPTTTTRQLSLPVEEPWTQTNPSFVAFEDGYWGTVRCVNYRINQGKYFVNDPDNIIRTLNYWVQLDSDLTLLSFKAMEDLSTWPRETNSPVQGLEDCRPFRFEGGWWASATARDISPDFKATMLLIQLNEKGDVQDAKPLHGFGEQLHQKNWMPIPGDSMRWLYSCDPAFIVQANSNTAALRVESGQALGLACEHWRGGGQLVEWENGWLGIIHETKDTPQGRQYLHRWIKTNSLGEIEGYSRPFYFFQLGIEFACGLTWDVSGTELVLSLGVNDNQAWLLKIPKNDIFRSLT